MSKRQRARPAKWLPLAIILAIAGCGAPSQTTGQQTAGRPAMGTQSLTISPSHSAKPTQEIRAALVSADGQHVTTVGTVGGAVASLVFSAAESPNVVTLALRVVPADCPCTTSAVIKQEHVTLTAPLGGRSVVDAATGQPVEIMSAKTLFKVGWLPASYAPVSADALSPRLDVGVGWVRTFAPAGAENSVDLTLTQYDGRHLGDLSPAGGSEAVISANGFHGQTWHDGGADQGYTPPVVGRHLVWYQQGSTFELDSVLNRRTAAKSVLSQDDLVRIARNLKPPG